MHETQETSVTMPNLMNCPHSIDGWCLDCVKALQVKGDADFRLLVMNDEWNLMKKERDALYKDSHRLDAIGRYMKMEEDNYFEVPINSPFDIRTWIDRGFK